MPDFQVERVYILFFLKLLKARHLIFMGIVSQICDAITLNLARLATDLGSERLPALSTI